MSDADQARLQASVDDMMKRLEKSHLNPMQKNAYLCSANCFDKKVDQANIQNCVQNCQQKTGMAQQVIQQEMGEFQNRLSRAMQGCQDKIKDSLAPLMMAKNPDNDKINDLAQKQMYQCGGQVVNEHIKLVAGIEKRLQSQLN